MKLKARTPKVVKGKAVKRKGPAIKKALPRPKQKFPERSTQRANLSSLLGTESKPVPVSDLPLQVENVVASVPPVVYEYRRYSTGEYKVSKLSPRALWSKYRACLTELRGYEATPRDKYNQIVEEAIEILLFELDHIYPYVAMLVLEVEGEMKELEDGHHDHIVISDLDLSDIPDEVVGINSDYYADDSIRRYQ